MSAQDNSNIPKPADSPEKKGQASSTATATDDLNDYIFVTRRKRHKKHKVRRALLIVFACLAGFVVLTVSTVFVLQSIGHDKLLDYQDVDMSAPVIDNMPVQTNEDGKVVFYNGKTYRFNENITSILCMGIDKEELALENDVIGTAGQADADFLVALDTATGKTTVINLSRDTMVDVNLYSESGQFLQTDQMQLCLSYAYGDGKETSCENTVRSVSRLFYGLPIHSYFAIDLEAISVLNDAVGGVEVTLQEDMRSPYGGTLNAGDTVLLVGDEAEQYVRYRDTEQLDSNSSRMERQKTYLQSFLNKALTSTKNDFSVPLKLYETATPYMVTNLSVDKVTYLALNTISHGGMEPIFESVPGTVQQGEEYAEFYPDEKALYEMILQVFYTEVEE